MLRRVVCSAAALLAGTALLTGCGISETAVIDAGPPAVQLTPHGARLGVFYVDHDGNAVPAPGATPTADRSILIDRLFGELPAAARSAGLRSDIPAVPYQTADLAEGGVRVSFTDPVSLPPTAVAQIGCTLGQAGAFTRVEIVAEPGGAPTAARCPRR